MRSRDPVAKDLRTPKYRQRVKPAKKESSEALRWGALTMPEAWTKAKKKGRRKNVVEK